MNKLAYTFYLIGFAMIVTANIHYKLISMFRKPVSRVKEHRVLYDYVTGKIIVQPASDKKPKAVISAPPIATN